MAKSYTEGLKIPGRRPEPKHNEQGAARAGIVICQTCYNTFYQKSWHAAGSRLLDELRLSRKGMHFSECPACEMIRHDQFGGEVLIENLTRKYEAEVIRLITAFGARATAQDPQDRLIKITRLEGGLRATLTENQTAVKLGKKLKSAFKGGHATLSISYAAEPEAVDQVRVHFAEPERQKKK